MNDRPLKRWMKQRYPNAIEVRSSEGEIHLHGTPEELKAWLADVSRAAGEAAEREPPIDPNDSSKSHTPKSGTCQCSKAVSSQPSELREALGGDEAKAAVVDFLDAWRFCPLSDAPSTDAVKANLEDAASQLLASLRAALATKEEGS